MSSLKIYVVHLQYEFTLFELFLRFIGLGFVAFTLRTWVLVNLRGSFMKELRSNLLFLLVLAVIAGFIIYLNN
jgi:hypothetical protein